MIRKIHLGNGLLCIGLAFAISSPASAGWGSYGSGGSFGSTGSSSLGSSGSSFGSSHGSWGGSSGGSWGGSSGGSWGGSSGGSWGGSSGGSGLFHGGLINRLRVHHHKKMSWLRSLGSRGGSWGDSSGGSSHGSSGGSWGGSYYSGSSHGSHGSSGNSTAATWTYSDPVVSESPVYYDTPVESGLPTEYPVEEATEAYPTEVEPTVDDAIETAPMPDLDGANLGAGNGSLIVTLPEDAKLFVNGQQTKSTGDKRQFVSRGLKPGLQYPYEVKAVLDVNGTEIVRTKKVSLRAGESNELAFSFDVQVPTNLTVRLPKDARLELAGAKTRSTGSERKFTTTKLTAGEVWSNYRVVVSYERAGKIVTKEQTIDLRGGDNRTLTFDFDVEQVAAAR